MLATLLPTQQFIFSENLAKLGIHTKLSQCDGTFRTAPSTTIGRFYQNLMLHFKFEGHVLPFFKAIMTGKSGPLYKVVFHKMKEELPESVKIETCMCDFEPALQNGLQEIFPDAIITGCWFHYSQVSKLELLYFCWQQCCQLYKLHFQCIFKHTVHFGLKACFVECEEFTVWVQLVMALPLLPQDRIVEAWSQLKIYPIPNMPNGTLGPWRKLKSYINKTWIQQRLHVLSVFGQEARTNNAVER